MTKSVLPGKLSGAAKTEQWLWIMIHDLDLPPSFSSGLPAGSQQQGGAVLLCPLAALSQCSSTRKFSLAEGSLISLYGP